jgi:UDP-N-acetylmuramyl pentapeptide phosphotransferase/UDP-N-acetylglucosamine-1-phosphate transferase
MQVAVAEVLLWESNVTNPAGELLLIGAVTVVVSVAACALTLRALSRWAVVDAPNERSSHKHPTPRGGGLGFMAVVLIGWTALWLSGSTNATPAVIAGAAAIAVISFADDLRGVPLLGRLAVQTVAVFVALATFPSPEPVLAWSVPLALERVIVAMSWLWFINLFNFMDGIDGIAAGEAVIIAFGLVLLAVIYPSLGLPSLEAVMIGAAVMGFLLFNWPPARMFMGDVGSAGLGFLLGWLLIVAARRGVVASALLLPLYFVVDATTTLLMRAWRGRPLAQGHRDHAYQNAVDKGLSHASVTLMVVGLGIALIALTILAVSAPVAALGVGLVLTSALIAWLRLR